MKRRGLFTAIAGFLAGGMTVAGLPGSTPAQIPAGQDELVRRMRDLERRVDELGPSISRSFQPVIDDLTAKQAVITATVNDLASRVTQTVTTATFNTGSLPNDATWHDYGPAFSITIPVPTGHMVVVVGCAEASLNSGGSSVDAQATFSISGGIAAISDHASRAFLSDVNAAISAPLFAQVVFSVPPGTYTITGQMRAWAGGSATASVNFREPFLNVQVTG